MDDRGKQSSAKPDERRSVQTFEAAYSTDKVNDIAMEVGRNPRLVMRS